MNTQPTSFDPQPTSQRPKYLPIIISILATAIIVGGGVFALEELRTNREIEKLQQEIFELKKIAQTQSETDDMDNWKTYTDEENGFIFKYPSYLNNKNGSGDNVTFTDSKVARTIVIDINNSNSDPINNYNTEIDGVQAYRFMEGAWECAASIYRMALKNSKQVELSFVPCKEGDLNTTEFLNIDEQNRILSTFKFLDTSTGANESASIADNSEEASYWSKFVKPEGTDWCTLEPIPLEIGREDYPINVTKYGDIGFLGELFTADDCSSKRVSKLFGVSGNNYTLQPDIGLRENPSNELIQTLNEVGFEKGSSCINTQQSSCKHWTLYKTVPLIDILKLKPFANYIKSSGCINCG